ncbi:MAG: hypothetical protein RI571_02965, partial [Roseovarius sp.]|nr:hypothetical protein [Roseovarius sp.]
MKFLGHESQAPAAAISAAMRGLAAPNRDGPRSADGMESFPDVLAALAGDVAPVAPQRPGAVGDAPPGVGITPSGGGDRPVQTGRPWAAPPPAAG